jgi:hypothetical protein
MKIKHNEIEVETTNPFANCKLDRQKYASILTEIINSYSDGFVLAINNKWGTGKTTFIKMWEQDLKNKNYQTVYFNAWENDFENNPLVALMGELKTLTKKDTEPEFQNTLKKAAIISKHFLPVVAQAIADKYIDTKEIKEAISGITKGIADIFESDVNQYAKKKKSIIEFRKSLSTFIANTNEGKPLVFIIDELDRCRPNYSVSILEQIKHFFSVPNIVFILSIDKEQLGNAIRGVYGSDRIDADEYLRRFIDLEYSIPEPEKNVYYKYLYDYFNFDEFLEKEARKRHYELNNDKRSFLDISDILFSNSSITLRQLEKIYSHSRLSIRSFAENMYLIPEVFLYLIFLKVKDEQTYNKIKFKQFTIAELQKSFFENVKEKLNSDIDKFENVLMWLEAYIVLYYNNYLQHYNRKNKIYQRDITSNENKLLIHSIINDQKDNQFLDIFTNIDRGRSSGNLDFGHFFTKIDLTEPIIS